MDHRQGLPGIAQQPNVIPAAQAATWCCPDCESENFKLLPAVRVVFDRLDPKSCNIVAGQRLVCESCDREAKLPDDVLASRRGIKPPLPRLLKE
jgi:hypothetical protein